MNGLWLRGGFPDSFQVDIDQSSINWREDFLRTCLERDIPALGPGIQAATLRRFRTMLAHPQGGLLNSAALAEGLGLTGQKIGRYLDLLVDLMLVRRLMPWHENAGKRLVKSPKVYVRDSGLVHALLGLGLLEGLLGHPVTSGSCEGFCFETLITAAPAGAQSYFYRSSDGAKLDLILRLPGRWFGRSRSRAPRCRSCRAAFTSRRRTSGLRVSCWSMPVRMRSRPARIPAPCSFARRSRCFGACSRQTSPRGRSLP